MEDIAQVLAGVPDWKGLANRLNIRSSDIDTNCAQDVAQASCYRRELVRRYCDTQLSENPSKVAEEIAEALEQMDHTLQAQQLRKLKFGKSVTKRSGPQGWDAMLCTYQLLSCYAPINCCHVMHLSIVMLCTYQLLSCYAPINCCPPPPPTSGSP